MSVSDDDRRRKLKAEIETLRGYWHPFHQGLLDMAPDYLAAYLDYQHAPARAGRLTPKECEFIYIAVDAAVSHLYAGGVARHIRMALDKGATPQEILEVIELATLTCHDSLETGLPILREEMAARGLATETALSEEERMTKARYEAAVGRWPEAARMLFQLAPDFVHAFLAYAEIPYADGPLSKKVKAFVGIAVCASPAAPREVPLRRHIGEALDAGAAPGDICDVLQLASGIAIHTCTVGVPALVGAMAATEVASK